MEKIDKYRILKRLGEGGFGAVYLAYDDWVERDVAIKLFRPRDKNLIAFATSSSEDGLQVLRERFVREARILGRLSDSPYIINVYELGETEEGSPYYVMPYVASHLGQLLGRDVFDRAALAELDRSDHPRALPLDECLTLLHQILQGMKTAHEHGLVHRDIKPLNILLSDAGEVRIGDFGIAKAPDGIQTTVSQLGMGSRNYMAPEQRESAKHVDGPADIYSIGVLAYRMLTGKLPTGRYADPEVVAPQLGKALNEVILKALEEDKDKRFRDAGEMLEAYEAALNQRAQEDEADSEVTYTDLSSDGPVSRVAEKYRPLYDTIKETLLEHGTITPRQREIEATAAVLKIDGKGLKSIVADVTAVHEEIPALQELLNLIERETGKLPAQTAGKETQAQTERLIGDLLPAAELAGKGRAWLEARMQGTLGEQDQSFIRHEPIRAFRDSLADGGEGPLMVVLPAGSFRMGCLNDDDDFYDIAISLFQRVSNHFVSDDAVVGIDEKPVHEVTLPNNFAMAVYEVTFDEYDRYVQATVGRQPDDNGWGRGDRPVIDVDWEEARAYARWLSEQTGRSYRLPTEAEWEYAARAGTTTKYSWGNKPSHLHANYRMGLNYRMRVNYRKRFLQLLLQGNFLQANYLMADYNYLQANYRKNRRAEGTARVGSFPANNFGLYGMHGNVLEWTQDCWHGSYRGAPTNGQAWEDANGGNCDRRVVRGGSWFHYPRDLRAASRHSLGVSRRSNCVGLRLVQDLL